MTSKATPARRGRLLLLLLPVPAIAWLLLGRSDDSRFDIYGDVGHLGQALECDSLTSDGQPIGERIGCMISLPAATVVIGAQSANRDQPAFDPAAGEDEGPPHPVTLRAFRIQRHEVSARQFERCVAAGGCQEKDVITTGGSYTYKTEKRSIHPINGVTWFGARDYCRWIGGRLPTEAEWEYAARGPEPRIYPWGNTPPDCDHAVMADARGPGCGNDSTRQVNEHPLKLKPTFSLVDMSGNVWEWVADWYDEAYYAKSPAENPQGPEQGTRRVQRGGGWTATDPSDLRSSGRAALEPTAQFEDLGFRCAADLPTGATPSPPARP